MSKCDKKLSKKCQKCASLCAEKCKKCENYIIAMIWKGEKNESVCRKRRYSKKMHRV